MEKLNLSFKPHNIARASYMQKMHDKINELIDDNSTIKEEIESGIGGDIEESKFPQGSTADVSIGGLSAGTDVSGKTAVEVLDTILFPELAPLWQDAAATWSKKSTYANKVYEIGSVAPQATEVTSYVTGTTAKATGGKNVATGGSLTSVVANGSVFGNKFTSVSMYSIGYTATFAAGTSVVKTNKGNSTNKTASNATTNLSDASANSSIGADFKIKSISKTDSVYIYSTYAIYATTSRIGTMTKQTLSKDTTITLSMPAETGTEKHSFAIPVSYTLSGVKILNTLSGKYEDYPIKNFALVDENYELPDKSLKEYKRYSRNDGTNGATTFQITFTRA